MILDSDLPGKPPAGHPYQYGTMLDPAGGRPSAPAIQVSSDPGSVTVGPRRGPPRRRRPHSSVTVSESGPEPGRGRRRRRGGCEPEPVTSQTVQPGLLACVP